MGAVCRDPHRRQPHAPAAARRRQRAGRRRGRAGRVMTPDAPTVADAHHPESGGRPMQPVRRRRVIVPTLAVAALLVVAPAQAQSFDGAVDVTLPNFARVPDAARCGAAATNALESWPSLAGTSAFGAFALASSNCVDRS